MPTGTPTRVVVADDSAMMRQIVSSSLSKAGVKIVGSAANGDEALAVCEREHPDALMLDLSMPGLDGLGVLHALQQPGRPTMPVIVVSAFSPTQGARAVDALAAGAFDLVAKPAIGVDLDMFAAKLVEKVNLAIASTTHEALAPANGASQPEGSTPREAAAPANDTSQRESSTAHETAARPAQPAKQFGFRKPAQPRKPFGFSKPAQASKPAPESTPAPDSKPALDSKPSPASKPAPESKPTPGSKLTADSKSAPASRPGPGSKAAPLSKPLVVTKPASSAPAIAPAGAGVARTVKRRRSPSGVRKVVLIATSTGGPRALAELMPKLPSPLGMGTLIVQHMPPGFTASLAARLDQSSRLQVREAKGGEALDPRVALIAPGGRHLRINTNGITTLSDEPEIGGLRPRADLMIEDAADRFADRTVLVVLTGMGNDGLKGAHAIRRRGGRIFSQTRETCTVYGMPRAVAEANLSDEVLSLDELAEAIAQEAA